MSVQRAQHEIPSSEYMDWIAYLDGEDLESFRRQDYYLANLTAEVRRSYVKEPMKVRMESFLLKFQRKGSDKPMSIEERTKQAKSFWGALLKASRKKK